MNSRLKELAQRGGMPLEKVAYLAGLLGDDGVEDVITMAQRTEKSADALRVAYKVVEQPAWSMAAAFRGEYDGGNR